ncbi:tRNA uridine-5-carboxymethylaminomethyl(34) synthesis GTPase MnmE [Neorhizobium sp. T786]|uniref:tRNA uridine-5-carboxymethylaminomethyl(34) synthesis GTPase MnmE n=1 Tax=Pseudorhizobium xiangyangii TaxID=2883104 RepID=UPI001CFFCD3C|nr:tRNA uridine-5-carboxymethylaminomethyl(34) synthesis GTPase MnmE [Neorhizobium xiangyangii]MCB5202188.1 tRNA uridine-5-carboxymethylaminomethyl(34) synthesis GTPase MnmE [Neorhizobium xiangyangii]
MTKPTDTIFALSSGALPAGVAVVRISGPLAFEALIRLTGKPPGTARHAGLRSVRDSQTHLIDQALVISFVAPHSFTGEDCVELQLHGSRAVVNAVLAELAAIDGCRLAEAGEFSRRAFENGRLDLVEAEGLAELIAAETEMQRRLAVEQGFGGQSKLYEGWAKRLTFARAMIEAELDFADEDDVPGAVGEQVTEEISSVQKEIEDHLSAAKAGEIIRGGYKVAIVGPPNAGKSSLINFLAQRDIAIVTDIEGTTRDVLHVDLDMDGYLVRVFDTAGLRETSDIVEREGVRRAEQLIGQADLVLLLAEIDSVAERCGVEAGDVLHIGTKLDIHGASSRYDICLSTVTGEGTSVLREAIIARIQRVWSGAVAPTRERQLLLLRETSLSVHSALKASELELRAEHLRAAASSLGRITGQVDVEQLLDVIFSQFCIGK